MVLHSDVNSGRSGRDYGLTMLTILSGYVQTNTMNQLSLISLLLMISRRWQFPCSESSVIVVVSPVVDKFDNILPTTQACWHAEPLQQRKGNWKFLQPNLPPFQSCNALINAGNFSSRNHTQHLSPLSLSFLWRQSQSFMVCKISAEKFNLVVWYWAGGSVGVSSLFPQCAERFTLRSLTRQTVWSDQFTETTYQNHSNNTEVLIRPGIMWGGGGCKQKTVPTHC